MDCAYTLYSKPTVPIILLGKKKILVEGETQLLNLDPLNVLAQLNFFSLVDKNPNIEP